MDLQKKLDGVFIKYACAVFLVSFVLVCAAYYINVYFLSGSLRGNSGFAEDDADGLAFVLFMGVDRREGDVGRTDTLMLAAIDEDQGSMTLLSIPRDTRVLVGDYGYDKINHAYAYGGHALTLASVQDLMGVPVQHYILIDTTVFERMVDAVGGVDITVEKRMYYEDPWDDHGGLVIDLEPGTQHMDGAHAIQYVRYRDGEGDIGRIARQQHFMQAVSTQIVSPQVLPRLPVIVEELYKAVETDLSVRQLVTLVQRFKDASPHGITMQTVTGTPAYLGDVSFWIPDITATRMALFEGVGKIFSESLLQRAEQDDAGYRAGMPDRLRVMADSKQQAGLASAEELLAEGDRMHESKQSHMAEKYDGTSNVLIHDKEASVPEDISVMVINSSGIDGAGAAAADILRAKGFRISSVETGRSSDRPKTAVMTAEEYVDLFYGMPFPCVIMPVDGAGAHQAILYIGHDYRGSEQKDREN